MSLVRQVANRAVHLKIYPRLSTVAESREVLRLISRIGPVEYFKFLGHDALSAPNTCLVIFRETETAKHLLDVAPIRFRMGRATLDELPPRDGTKSVIQQQSASWGDEDSSDDRSTNSSALTNDMIEASTNDSLLFQILASPSRAKYRDLIDYNNYHGSFPLDPNSIAQHNLVQSVPLAGLSCINWRGQKRAWTSIDRPKESERHGPNRRKSLGEIYDQAVAAKS